MSSICGADMMRASCDVDGCSSSEVGAPSSDAYARWAVDDRAAQLSTRGVRDHCPQHPELASS